MLLIVSNNLIKALIKKVKSLMINKPLEAFETNKSRIIVCLTMKPRLS